MSILEVMYTTTLKSLQCNCYEHIGGYVHYYIKILDIAWLDRFLVAVVAIVAVVMCVYERQDWCHVP